MLAIRIYELGKQSVKAPLFVARKQRVLRRIAMRFLTINLFSLLLVGCVVTDEREETVCGFIQEPLLFWLWSSAAPTPDKDRALISPFIEPAEFTTSDGKTLRGYQYSSHNTDKQKTQAKGYVLMALGNAMIADQIISSMRYMAVEGYDVYIFDYRGYGNSDGKRRINAIIKDYQEIIPFLNSHYDKHFLYGISLGGAVILNAIGSGVDYDLAVIDSSPSKFSDHGCPEKIDPISNLPDDASKLFVITGKKDPVLKPEMTSPLRIEAGKRGAKVLNGHFSHPYMDRDPNAHQNRMIATLMFFSKAQGGDN